MATVSIIMASYNYAGFIGEAVGSVQAQSFQDWELLIVDDGSTDGSLAAVENFCRHDGRIKLLTHPGNVNRGLAATVKRGVDAATGKYIAFLESDDRWLPENLARKVTILDSFPEVALVDDKVTLFGESDLFDRYRNYRVIRERHFSACTFPADIFHALFYENLIPTFSCAVCRSDALKNCSFEHVYTPHLDRSLWMQICKKHKFYHLDENLTCWRIHSKSCISREKSAYRQNFWRKACSLLLPCYNNRMWSAGFIWALTCFVLVNIRRALGNRLKGRR